MRRVGYNTISFARMFNEYKKFVRSYCLQPKQKSSIYTLFLFLKLINFVKFIFKINFKIGIVLSLQITYFPEPQFLSIKPHKTLNTN